jgi:hypothetical protein
VVGAEETGPAMSCEGDAAVAEGATTVRRGEREETTHKALCLTCQVLSAIVDLRSPLLWRSSTVLLA